MPQKFIPFLVVVFAFLGLLVYSVQAQDNAPIDSQEKEIKELNATHPELNLDDNKILLIESESQKTQTTIIKEATPVAKPTKSKSDKTQADKEEEDAMSFNFLYYIIQKFKVSDIVD